MSGWLVVLSMLAALDPARTAAALGTTPRKRRLGVVGVGAVVAAGVLILVAALGDAILDGLDITDETWRMAAGIVVGLAGVKALLGGPTRPVPAPLSRPLHAIVPVAFPLLLRPESVVLAVLYGATESTALAFGAIAVGVAAAGTAAAVTSPSPGATTATALSRMLGALLVVAAVALVVAGIRDV
jgi:small neutral amino acid transporter SnatA (MarC family)